MSETFKKIIFIALVVALTVPLFIGGLELRKRLYSRDHCHPEPTSISYDMEDCQ